MTLPTDPSSDTHKRATNSFESRRPTSTVAANSQADSRNSALVGTHSEIPGKLSNPSADQRRNSPPTSTLPSSRSSSPSKACHRPPSRSSVSSIMAGTKPATGRSYDFDKINNTDGRPDRSHHRDLSQGSRTSQSRPQSSNAYDSPSVHSTEGRSPIRRRPLPSVPAIEDSRSTEHAFDSSTSHFGTDSSHGDGQNSRTSLPPRRSVFGNAIGSSARPTSHSRPNSVVFDRGKALETEAPHVVSELHQQHRVYDQFDRSTDPLTASPRLSTLKKSVALTHRHSTILPSVGAQRLLPSGTTAPSFSRPTSPTKTGAGFVQSAMLRRNDSITKRWSMQARPTEGALERRGSVTSVSSNSELGGVRRSHLIPKNLLPGLDDLSAAQKSPSVSFGHGHRVSASMSDLGSTSTPTSAPPSRTPLPTISDSPQLGPSPSVISSPPSPGKRWSPSKSSWLESALSKRDVRPATPPMKPKVEDQPLWMAKLAKAKASKHSTPDVNKQTESQVNSDALNMESKDKRKQAWASGRFKGGVAENPKLDDKHAISSSIIPGKFLNAPIPDLRSSLKPVDVIRDHQPSTSISHLEGPPARTVEANSESLVNLTDSSVTSKTSSDVGTIDQSTPNSFVGRLSPVLTTGLALSASSKHDHTTPSTTGPEAHESTETPENTPKGLRSQLSNASMHSNSNAKPSAEKFDFRSNLRPRTTGSGPKPSISGKQSAFPAESESQSELEAIMSKFQKGKASVNKQEKPVFPKPSLVKRDIVSKAHDLIQDTSDRGGLKIKADTLIKSATPPLSSLPSIATARSSVQPNANSPTVPQSITVVEEHQSAGSACPSPSLSSTALVNHRPISSATSIQQQDDKFDKLTSIETKTNVIKSTLADRINPALASMLTRPATPSKSQSTRSSVTSPILSDVRQDTVLDHLLSDTDRTEPSGPASNIIEDESTPHQDIHLPVDTTPHPHGIDKLPAKVSSEMNGPITELESDIETSSNVVASLTTMDERPYQPPTDTNITSMSINDDHRSPNTLDVVAPTLKAHVDLSSTPSAQGLISDNSNRSASSVSRTAPIEPSDYPLALATPEESTRDTHNSRESGSEFGGDLIGLGLTSFLTGSVDDNDVSTRVTSLGSQDPSMLVDSSIESPKAKMTRDSYGTKVDDSNESISRSCTPDLPSEISQDPSATASPRTEKYEFERPYQNNHGHINQRSEKDILINPDIQAIEDSLCDLSPDETSELLALMELEIPTVSAPTKENILVDNIKTLDSPEPKVTNVERVDFSSSILPIPELETLETEREITSLVLEVDNSRPAISNLKAEEVQMETSINPLDEADTQTGLMMTPVTAMDNDVIPPITPLSRTTTTATALSSAAGSGAGTAEDIVTGISNPGRDDDAKDVSSVVVPESKAYSITSDALSNESFTDNLTLELAAQLSPSASDLLPFVHAPLDRISEELDSEDELPGVVSQNTLKGDPSSETLANGTEDASMDSPVLSDVEATSEASSATTTTNVARPSSKLQPSREEHISSLTVSHTGDDLDLPSLHSFSGLERVGDNISINDWPDVVQAPLGIDAIVESDTHEKAVSVIATPFLSDEVDTFEERLSEDDKGKNGLNIENNTESVDKKTNTETYGEEPTSPVLSESIPVAAVTETPDTQFSRPTSQLYPSFSTVGPVPTASEAVPHCEPHSSILPEGSEDSTSRLDVSNQDSDLETSGDIQSLELVNAKPQEESLSQEKGLAHEELQTQEETSTSAQDEVTIPISMGSLASGVDIVNNIGTDTTLADLDPLEFPLESIEAEADSRITQEEIHNSQHHVLDSPSRISDSLSITPQLELNLVESHGVDDTITQSEKFGGVDSHKPIGEVISASIGPSSEPLMNASSTLSHLPATLDSRTNPEHQVIITSSEIPRETSVDDKNDDIKLRETVPSVSIDEGSDSTASSNYNDDISSPALSHIILINEDDDISSPVLSPSVPIEKEDIVTSPLKTSHMALLDEEDAGITSRAGLYTASSEDEDETVGPPTMLDMAPIEEDDIMISSPQISHAAPVEDNDIMIGPPAGSHTSLVEEDINDDISITEVLRPTSANQDDDVVSSATVSRTPSISDDNIVHPAVSSGAPIDEATVNPSADPLPTQITEKSAHPLLFSLIAPIAEDSPIAKDSIDPLPILPMTVDDDAVSSPLMASPIASTLEALEEVLIKEAKIAPLAVSKKSVIHEAEISTPVVPVIASSSEPGITLPSAPLVIPDDEAERNPPTMAEEALIEADEISVLEVSATAPIEESEISPLVVLHENSTEEAVTTPLTAMRKASVDGSEISPPLLLEEALVEEQEINPLVVLKKAQIDQARISLPIVLVTEPIAEEDSHPPVVSLATPGEESTISPSIVSAASPVDEVNINPPVVSKEVTVEESDITSPVLKDPLVALEALNDEPKISPPTVSVTAPVDEIETTYPAVFQKAPINEAEIGPLVVSKSAPTVEAPIAEIKICPPEILVMPVSGQDSSPPALSMDSPIPDLTTSTPIVPRVTPIDTSRALPPHPGMVKSSTPSPLDKPLPPVVTSADIAEKQQSPRLDQPLPELPIKLQDEADEIQEPDSPQIPSKAVAYNRVSKFGSDAASLFSVFFGFVPKLVPGDADSFDAVSILQTSPYDKEVSSSTNNPKNTIKVDTYRLNLDGEAVALNKDQRNVFYASEMFAVVHTYTPQPAPGASPGGLFGAVAAWRTRKPANSINVWLWVGSRVSPDVVASGEGLAQQAAKISGGSGRDVVQTIHQSKEPLEFLDFVKLPLSTFFSPCSPGALYPTGDYMVCVRRHRGRMVLDETDIFSLKRLSSGFPFIVVTGAGSRSDAHIIVWKGKGSYAEEIACAREQAQLIARSFVSSGPVSISEVDEGSETDAFVDYFPDSQRKFLPRCSEGWKRRAKYQQYHPRFFRFSPGSEGGSSNVSVVEIAPFSVTDFQGAGTIMIDAWSEIYILPSPECRAYPEVFTSTLSFTQDYSILAPSVDGRPFVPVSNVIMEGFPRDVKAVVRGWVDGKAWDRDSHDLLRPTGLESPEIGFMGTPGERRVSAVGKVVGLTEAITAVRSD